MRSLLLLGALGALGLAGCVENGPVLVPWLGGDVTADGGTGDEGSGPPGDAEPDTGPPTILCTTNEECQALDPTGNATIRCVDGRCAIVSCAAGQGDANGDVTDGCECVLSADGESPVCDGGDGDCDGRVDEETDFSSDLANCGTCGAACGEGLATGLLHIEALACRGGRCAIERCEAAWFNPTGRVEDGCRCVAQAGIGLVPLVSPDAELVGSIFDAEESSHTPPPDPRLVYGRDGTGLLVWTRTRWGEPTDWVIRAMRVDGDGFPLGSAHTLAEYPTGGDAEVVGLYALEGGTFAVHVHYEDPRGDGRARRILATYAEGIFDRPSASSDPQFVFPAGVGTPAPSIYRVAPSGTDLCAAAITLPNPDTQVRSIIELGAHQALAVITPERDGGVTRSRTGALLALVCPSDGCDCLVAWLEDPQGDRTLKVNNSVVDVEPSPMTRVPMAWGDVGALMLWSRDAGAGRDAYAARLDPATGAVVAGPEPVISSAGNDSASSGIVFADDDGDGSAEPGEAFVLTWANGHRDEEQAANEFARLDAAGIAFEGRTTVPDVASGRVGGEVYYTETPPQTFDRDGILTVGPPWPAPSSAERTRLKAVHGGPLGERGDVSGGWLVWHGFDGIYATRLTADTTTPQTPVTVSRGTADDVMAAVTIDESTLGVVSARADRVLTTLMGADGNRASVAQALTPAEDERALTHVDAMAWPDGRILAVIEAEIAGARSQTVGFVGVDESPIELAPPTEDAGVDSQVGGPGGSAGALWVSWRDGPQQDALFARSVDAEGRLGSSRPLSNVQTRGPVDVVYNPVSGHTFVAWLASQSNGCSMSSLSLAVYDAQMMPLTEPTVVYGPADDGPCLNWLRIVPNAAGGISVVVGQRGQGRGLIANTDPVGGLMGAPEQMNIGGFNHLEAMDLMATASGAVGFYIERLGGPTAPARLRSVEYRCD